MRLTRGRLAAKTGCNGETVRYYERIGLMPPPARTAAGHRIYDDDDARRLAFILRGRQLGFSIEDLRGLLGLVDRGAYSCASVREIAAAHRSEIRRKIDDLRRLERTLQTMIAACDDGRHPDCPVIDALSTPL